MGKNWIPNIPQRHHSSGLKKYLISYEKKKATYFKKNFITLCESTWQTILPVSSKKVPRPFCNSVPKHNYIFALVFTAIIQSSVSNTLLVSNKAILVVELQSVLNPIKSRLFKLLSSLGGWLNPLPLVPWLRSPKNSKTPQKIWLQIWNKKRQYSGQFFF